MGLPLCGGLSGRVGKDGGMGAEPMAKVNCYRQQSTLLKVASRKPNHRREKKLLHHQRSRKQTFAAVCNGSMD